MWGMYRENTIHTMRQRHDNFDFKKAISHHKQKSNLIKIGSFLEKPNETYIEMVGSIDQDNTDYFMEGSIR